MPIGGETLRALVSLGISLTYRDKGISALELSTTRTFLPTFEQISFQFEAPYALEDIPEGVKVTVARKLPKASRSVIQIRLVS
jgi:hypothetical protein